MANLISADFANNQLCILEYTTSDGEMLSFEDNAFDAEIVLHTYTDKGKIIFDKSITTIGGYAFFDCKNLTSITIPNSVTTIEAGAFQRCSNLTSVTIGNSVSEIGEFAFKGCNLETIVCYPKIPPKLNNSFDKFDNLIVPTGCEEAYANSDWGRGDELATAQAKPAPRRPFMWLPW